MATTVGPFARWLSQAGISPERLTGEQEAVLQAAWRFRQQKGEDYYLNRLLSHFLLNSGSGLKVAQIARLLAVNRVTASRQQGLSSKEVIQAAHHRMAGRSHGKLLPRYAGPIAEFVLSHPDATRFDTIEFSERTFGVRVSTVALHKFLKKYGLDRASRGKALAAANEGATTETESPGTPDVVFPAQVQATVSPGQPVPLPPAPFLSRPRTTRGPSC